MRVLILLFLIIFSFSTLASDHDVDDWLNGRPVDTIEPLKTLDCSELSDNEQFVCEVIVNHINNALNNANIQLNNGDLVYSANVVPGNIPTGHQCSRRLEAHSGWYKIYIAQDLALGFAQSTIDEPAVIYAKIPLRLDSDTQLESKLGFNEVFGDGCTVYGRDHFSAQADMMIDTEHAMSFIVDPKFGYTEDGDLFISIKPKFYFISDVDDIEINYDFDDTNIFHDFMNAVRHKYQFLTFAFEGLVHAINDPDYNIIDLYKDMNILLYVGYYAQFESWGHIFDIDLSEEIIDLLQDNGRLDGNDKLDAFSRDLENYVNGKISSKLGLDENGMMYFVIPKAEIYQEGYSKFLPAVNMLMINSDN